LFFALILIDFAYFLACYAKITNRLVPSYH
jgi:hypothetical protein